MDGNILTGKAPEKETRQNGNTAFRNMPAPNRYAAPLPATDNHHTITNTLMTNTKLFCCVPAMLLILCLSALGCRKTLTSPELSPALRVEDVSCIEAWCRLQTGGGSLPAQVQIFSNEKQVMQFTASRADTILIIDSLKPKQNYTLKAKLTFADGKKAEANATTITMDTTSHEIHWQDWTIGDYGLSRLRDVVITDDGRIAAAGELYFNDSNGNPLQTTFNLIEWDGGNWRPQQVKFHTFCGTDNQHMYYYPATAISEGDSNNLFIGSYGKIAHWDGNKQTFSKCMSADLIRFYRRGTKDIFSCGYGKIMHYNGVEWQIIPTGTEQELTDIAGAPGLDEVWACGWDSHGHSKLFRIKNDIVTMFWSNEISHPFPYFMQGQAFASVSVFGKEVYLTGSPYLVKVSLLDTSIVRTEMIQTGNIKQNLYLDKFGYCMRGTAKNDIFIACEDGLIWHFNGMTWQKYTQFRYSGYVIRPAGMAAKNKIVIVGHKGTQAYIIMGTR